MSLFVKIVQSLAFSPQIASQLAFYARRLRRENFTRKLSVIAGIGAVTVQGLMVFAAPTPSNASSSNDICFGGVTSTADLVRMYDQGCSQPGQSAGEVQAIFSYFKISRADLAATTPGSADSRDKSLKSLGRNPHGAGDQRIVIPGTGQVVYLRPLHVWDVRNPYNIYPALVGRRSGAGNSYFAIIKSCGNIVVKDIPPPVISPSKEVLPGSPAAGSTVTPGQTVGFRIRVPNTGGSPATNLTITDPVPANTTVTWVGTGAAQQVPAITSKPLIWRWDQIPAGNTGYYTDFSVRINADAPAGQVCNRASVRSDQTGSQDTNQVCYTVVRPQSPPPPPAPPPPPPPPPNITQNKSAVYINRVDADGKPTAADATTAQAGDLIEYKLTTINTGGSEKKDYVVEEELADVLEYADLADKRGGTLDGHTLRWPKKTIPAGGSIENTFVVQVKSPIPTTARSASDPSSFDLVMNNFYGKEVNINLSLPPVPGKQVEVAAAKLPQTGPVENALVLAFFALVVYFYLRNRQLMAEIQILRVEEH